MAGAVGRDERVVGSSSRPYRDGVSRPELVLDRLAADLQSALGEDLLSLAVHGSWVFGDFTPGRSDLDLVAVLATDPTATLLTQLSAVHAGIERDYPDWA